MFRLDNKIAVVTGSGSGIGKAVSKLFAQQGAVVHVIDITEDTGNLVGVEIGKAGGKAHIHACDISKLEEVEQVFNTIGKLDILVNNAGIAHVGNVENTSAEDMDRIYEVNVKGVFHCLKAGLRGMKERGGVITNLCSIAAHVGLVDRFAYSMSKGAVHGMTLSIAKDYLRSGIRCNSVSPARVHTPFVDGFIAKNYPGREKEMFEKLSASQPIGRMGTVEEIAALILFLSSNEASFITGNDYAIDGGFIKLNN